MTKIYFVRHAESDASVRDGRVRPLTQKGVEDARRLPVLFAGIHVDRIYSSPFRRAVDTVSPIAQDKGLPILPVEDFRERRSDSLQNMEMAALIRRQWEDFSFTISDGECFAAVQKRNLSALQTILEREEGNTVLIGTHGVAMSLMLHHYAPLTIKKVGEILLTLPYIACLSFEGLNFCGMEEISFLS